VKYFFADLSEEYQNNGLLDLGSFAILCHGNAKARGFWDNPYSQAIYDIGDDQSIPQATREKVIAILKRAGNRNRAEMIALEHSELTERLEAVRSVGKDGEPALSEKITGFTLEEEEAADALIRLLDYAVGCRLRLLDAAMAKMAYNLNRPYKHGRKF